MSTPPPANRADGILDAVLDLDSSAREVFLIDACDGDPALLAEVRALLAAHVAMPTGFLAQPAMEEIAAGELDVTVRSLPVATPPLHAAERAGEMIGNYKLREQIGEGGFGTVWVADQEQPVRRRVALKIIKLGMDTKEVIARFEQERQALAMMDHPNIARVLDAGVTQTGRPYFVMELVRGVKITDYCDDKGLSTSERIDLFIHVCQAVQHAHQKGIIHRDLKPSNILVTINDGVAVPKVIDFGVAKATQGRLTDGTIYTQFQQMIGTPLYMSPEQAEMTSLDVDTRSDIYALGVLLYELLTGRTPIDTTTMAKAGMDEIRRLIREVDPPKPSARLKTLAGDELTSMAKRRHTEPAKLPGALRGDLDWIVMKCIEKDRSRRYDTANGLALDLQRHLKNEVVIARPPTTGYLLSKLIRRNKLAFIAGTSIAASLVIGIAASLWQAVRVEREKQRAVAALDELRAAAPAFVEQARGLAAKERFDEAIEKLDYAIKLRPDAAEFLVAKGDLLQCQFKLAEAAAIYREALRVKPGLARAEASAKLCDELLAAPRDPDGKLTRASLGRLHLEMQKQQRPPAELLPAARLLREEKSLIVASWLERLKDLPISADKPLDKRLTVREDGLLELDLQGTKIADLAPLAGMPLGKLVLWDCKQLTDFTPLREFRSLTYLDLDGTGISELSALRGLPLEELWLARTKISDLSPLLGMKLKILGIQNAKVADLSPLAGMPLNDFSASTIPATDFSPLKGAPLEHLAIERSLVRDLSFLAGSPIKELCLYGCDTLRGLALLRELKSLERLILPQSFRSLPDEERAAIGALRSHPRLQWIQADPGEGNSKFWLMFRATQPKEVFWQDWDREQTFVPAIRKAGFDFSLSKLPIGTYRLVIEKQALTDLSILQEGAPISELHVGGCNITDLAPIRQLPLRVLRLWSNPVADLTPLRGMAIEELSIEHTSISDLSPLKGLPLTKLYLHGCKKLTDVSPLAEIPSLETLTVPITARGIDALRQRSNLKWLAFRSDSKNPNLLPTTAAVFWKRWPSLAWSRALNEIGMTYSAVEDAEGNWAVTVTSKEFSDCSIFKGAPIRELILTATSVADLRPLEGLALTKLDIRQTQVTDLSSLRAATLGGSLREVNFSKCNVTDFSPLAACKDLEVLDASDTLLADLSVIRGRKLRQAQLMNTKVTDLSILTGMPLTTLTLSGTAVTDLSPLLQCPQLETLVLPEGARNVETLRALPALTGISYTLWRRGTTPPKAADFWKQHDQGLWQAKLRESGFNPKILKQQSDFTWEVNLGNSEFSDLTVLSGARISSLKLGHSAVTNLEPLRGMTDLKKLAINETNVSDLSPLEGMQIEELFLNNTKVADLSALHGMPLTRLTLRNCGEIRDLSPLADCKTLKVLTLPPNPKDIEFLRLLPLERLGYHDGQADGGLPGQPAKEFWREYDAKKQ